MILVSTSQMKEVPELVAHLVLGKWLYLPENTEDFEELATWVTDLIARDDPRIGAVLRPKKNGWDNEFAAFVPQ